MNLKSCDIVYLVKNTKYNGELRYSLRSVCKNFPHRKIWFVGGLPEGIKPDYYIPVDQTDKTGPNDKYDNVNKLINAIMENKAISNNFVLFHDDFFVLKPVKKLPLYANGTLQDTINFVEIAGRTPNSKYINILKKEIELLSEAGLPCNSFAVHVPILINKVQMKNVLNYFGVFYRSLYGNFVYAADYTTKDCKFLKDVKIYNNIQIPSEDQVYVSTSDGSFNLGEVGKYIRNKFPDPCEYEYE